MTEKPPKKSRTASELDLIKSALSANLDETTVDIFKEDLFSTSDKKGEERAKPAEPGPIPEQAEEIKLPSAEANVQLKKPEKPLKEMTGSRGKGSPEPEKLSKTGEEMALKIEAGEFHSVTAIKDEDKAEATAELLMKLEKMGDDFLSAEEMRKLFLNVNLLIELLQKALSRLELLERRLKEKGVL